MGSTISGDAKVTGRLAVGTVASPPEVTGGAGAMDTTNRANGSLHMRTDAMPELKVNSQVKKVGLADHAIECRADDLTANGTMTYTTYIPANATITGVKRRYTVVPASAAGTVLTSITVDGNEVLASGSEDEEGLTNDTLTAHSLTATSADLDVDDGHKVVITITSNNADMTGGTDPMYYIYYQDRAAA